MDTPHVVRRLAGHHNRHSTTIELHIHYFYSYMKPQPKLPMYVCMYTQRGLVHIYRCPRRTIFYTVVVKFSRSSTYI